MQIRFSEIFQISLPGFENRRDEIHGKANGENQNSPITGRYPVRHLAFPLPEFPYFCTCKLARRLWPGLENHRLNTLCDYLGFRFEHHQAGEDAAAAAFIVRRMLEATGAADWRELLEKLRINPGLVSPRGCVGCRVVPKGKSR